MSLKVYVESLKEYGPLTSEELTRLGKILLKECNDEGIFPTEEEIREAKNTLLWHHQKYVVGLVYTEMSCYRNVPHDEMTLLSAGNDGLMKAIEKWDYKKGALTTYSRRSIQREIRTCIHSMLSKDEYDDSKFAAAPSSYVPAEVSEETKRLLNLAKNLTFKDVKTQFILQSLTRQYLYTSAAPEEITASIMRKLKISKETLAEHMELIKKALQEAVSSAEFSKESDVDISDFMKLLSSISSGETKVLEMKQADYGKLFDVEEGILSGTPSVEKLWKFGKFSLFQRNFKQFYQTACEIKSVPCYKYVLRFLLQEFGITLGEANEKKLFSLEGDWGLAVQSYDLPETDLTGVAMSETDCHKLMKYLCLKVEEDFRSSGLTLPKGAWTTHFKNNIVNALKSTQLNELALVYHMNLDTYLAFRMKVLKIRQMDFLDREFLFTYFVLKYADSCQMYDWVNAYEKLVELYGATESALPEADTEFTSTISLSENYFLSFETGGRLKPEYYEVFFTEKLGELETFFQQTYLLSSQNTLRTFQKEFEKQWTKLWIHFTDEKYDEIVEMVRENKETQTKKYLIDTAKMMHYLYGYGSDRLKAKDFKALRKNRETEDFLCSEIFDDTMITNNRIIQFGKLGNLERRNMLLTVLFLNYTFQLNEPDYSLLTYTERVQEFKYMTAGPLAKCGFMILHPSNAYDHFLLLLLTCKNPLDLFRHIWHLKTNELMKVTKNDELTR